MSRRLKILIAFVSAFVVLLLGGLTVIYSLNAKIARRLEKGWVIPPLELYSQGFVLSPGRHLNQAGIQEELKRRNLQLDRDYFLGTGSDCERVSGVSFKDTAAKQCL